MKREKGKGMKGKRDELRKGEREIGKGGGGKEGRRVGDEE